MKKRDEIKELKERIKSLETEKRDELSYIWFIFFLLLLPITILGYFMVSFYYAFYKLFHLFDLTPEEKKLYYIGNSFNPCSYMWDSIAERKGEQR